MADSTIGFEFNPLAGYASENDTEISSHDFRSPREEQLLIQALQRGDAMAYEVLLARYQTPVYNLVYRLMSDPCDSCDVVQEVFLKIFRNIGSFRGNSSLKTWVYRIAFNEAYNQRRWFGRHKKQEIGLETDEEGHLNIQDVLPDPGRSAFDIAADHQTQELIEEALAEVNPSFRAAVVLRDIEDLSYDEIAEVLQVSLGTVKSRILRGREALRKALAGRLRPDIRTGWAPEAAPVKP